LASFLPIEYKDERIDMLDQNESTLIKRIAQGIGVLSFLMLTAAVILAVNSRQVVVNYILGDFGWLFFIFFINAIVAIVLALLIISRQPRQVIGWLFLAVGFLYSWWFLSNLSLELIGLSEIPGPIRPLVILGGLAYLLPLMITISLVPLFFPDGRLLSRRWRLVLGTVLVGILGQTLIQGLLDVLAEFPQLDRGGFESNLTRLNGIAATILILGIVGSLASLVVRFIRSRGDERTQMKWLVYTATLSISTMLLMSAVLGEDSLILGVFSSALPTYLTIAIGIAILRHRLYDIDLIIRKTLVYALLTGLLSLVYFGGVALSQSLLHVAGGQSSPVVIVLTTLLIAALFNPLRRRIQDFIDRRFYRQKYDAEKALADFAAHARSETDLTELSEHLTATVRGTLQPEQVTLWILPAERKS